MLQTTAGTNDGAAIEPGWRKKDWQLLLVLLIAAAVAFGIGLSAFGILDPSDGYYSEGAREMFESGNWLIPQLNYAWFFDKPIMNYWLIASCFKMVGVSEWASRLPAATCGALLVPGLYAFGRQFLCRRAALIGSLALLSCPMWLIMGHMSLTDMPLSFFTWIALGCLFVALEKNKNSLVWIAYVAIGCGLLTKGPVAVFLVGMNLGLYVLLKRPSLASLWAVILRLNVLPGLLLSVAIAAPWYLAVNKETHGLFVQEFFVNQNINRAMGTVDHKAGIFYYVPAALGAAFPWNLFELVFFRTWFRPWRRFVTREFGDAIPLRICATAFGVTSAVGTLLFFSLLATKLVTYILPIVPALALVAGVTVDKVMRVQTPLKIPTVTLASLIALISAGGASIIMWSILAPHSILFGGKFGAVAQTYLQASDELVRLCLLAALTVFTAGAVLLLVLTVSGKKALAYKYFTALTVVATITAVPSAIVLSYQQKCRDMQSLIIYARKQRLSPIVLGHRNPSAIFYMGSKIKYLSGPKELESFLVNEKAGQAAAASHFLVHQSIYSNLKKSGQELVVVRQSGEWILGRKK